MNENETREPLPIAPAPDPSQASSAERDSNQTNSDGKGPPFDGFLEVWLPRLYGCSTKESLGECLRMALGKWNTLAATAQRRMDEQWQYTETLILQAKRRKFRTPMDALNYIQTYGGKKYGPKNK